MNRNNRIWNGSTVLLALNPRAREAKASEFKASKGYILKALFQNANDDDDNDNSGRVILLMLITITIS